MRLIFLHALSISPSPHLPLSFFLPPSLSLCFSLLFSSHPYTRRNISFFGPTTPMALRIARSARETCAVSVCAGCARERFTPDYYGSQASDRGDIGSKKIRCNRAKSTRKIVKRPWTIYRGRMVRVGGVESIYLVGKVCAANTVG